jgi:hypothetical protein
MLRKRAANQQLKIKALRLMLTTLISGTKYCLRVKDSLLKL